MATADARAACTQCFFTGGVAQECSRQPSHRRRRCAGAAAQCQWCAAWGGCRVAEGDVICDTGTHVYSTSEQLNFANE
eukprot:4363655-Prymnesium_polylepis.1